SNLVEWRNAGSRRSQNPIDYGQRVAVRNFHFPSEKNKEQALRLSLDDLLPAGEFRDGVYELVLGAVDPRISRSSDATDDDEEQLIDRTTALVTLSDIGLSAKSGRQGVTIWATSLSTAKPIQGVRARVYSNKNQLLGQIITDADGLGQLKITPASGEDPTVIVADQPASEVDSGSSDARTGWRNLTWLDLRSGAINLADGDTGGKPYLRNGFEAFVYSDRGVYRPGETVHLRAIVRGPEHAKPGTFPIRWDICRPDLRIWQNKMQPLDGDGASSMDLALPDDLPTGRWTARIELPGDEKKPDRAFGQITFLVEEFMPQRMKVAAEIRSGEKAVADGGRVSADALEAHVQGDYLFGKPAAGLTASGVVRLEPVGFAPQHFEGWTFGDSADTGSVLSHGRPLPRRAELSEEHLDAKGHAKWALDFQDLIDTAEIEKPAVKVSPRRRGRKQNLPKPATEPAAKDYVGPWRLTFSTSVKETGGRAITSVRQADVDLAPYYLALHCGQTARPGGSIAAEFELVQPDEKIATEEDTASIRLYRENWNTSYVYESGAYHYHSTRVLEPVGPQDQAVEIRDGHASISIPSVDAGTYVLCAVDRATGETVSLRIPVFFGAWEDTISRENPERLEVHVKPGRIGHTSNVEISSPFGGRLLLSVETDDVLKTRVVEMSKSHMVVPIEIPAGCGANAYVVASVIRAVDPNASWRTHRAIGAATLPIDCSGNRLAIDIAAPTEIRPGRSLGVDLRIKDANGKPVSGAAVTVAAVDEGICALTNFATPDPLAFFDAKRALSVASADIYGRLMPEEARAQKQSAVGGDQSGGMAHHSPVSAKRVRPVALWSGVLHTDADGFAHADFSLPQFLGKLRIMAVVSSDAQFGSAAKPILVRSPLMVQSSWPRFCAPGDRFSVPLVLFNNSAIAGEAKVSIELLDGPRSTPLEFRNQKERVLSLPEIHVPGNGQGAAAFEIRAADRAGVARVRLSVSMNSESYVETVELPVRPASPMVADGGYAIATMGKPALVWLPKGMLAGTERFELRVSPRPQLGLPEGLDYLDRYPYGCLEQTTSTLFPLVYLPDLGKEISPELFDHDRMNQKIQAGLWHLASMQTSDGGLAMWPGGTQAWRWGTVYAAHFMVEAQIVGYSVPDSLRQPTLNYLKGLFAETSDDQATLETQAYAAYVLARAGMAERPAMQRLEERLKGSVDSEAQLHLALAWLFAGRRDRAAELMPRAMPTFQGSRQLSATLDSPIRLRAMWVEALLWIEPENPALPHLAQELADAGSRHQWLSTQDTAMAMLAISHYLRQNKSSESYESAEILLDGKTIARSERGAPLVWTAASMDPEIHLGSINPNAAALPPDGSKLEVRITGAPGAQAYISWLHSGVPVHPPADSDQGLKVRRKYLDEHGEPIGDQPIQSGQLVQVELDLQSGAPLENLVIEDLLPAGLEIENPRLEGQAGDGQAKHPMNKGDNAFSCNRVEMRDDRMVVMGQMVQAGEGRFVYTARAVTSGDFVLPPVSAECMYDLGTSSIGGAARIKVKHASSAAMAGTDPQN
ncbi:MAG TPA: MG2 domain-containing protein, partial [Tepidisphaeraceae bacterium]|nr:MG2 domain-containing protein [Tepidisphaeraceae bacterium]